MGETWLGPVQASSRPAAAPTRARKPTHDASTPAVIVVGCARNCAKDLPACLRTLEGVARVATDCCGGGGPAGWVLFENDSDDGTLAVLEAFRRAGPRRHVVSEVGLDAWLPKRTHRLAHGRNMLLRRVELLGWLAGATLLVIADLDDVNKVVDLGGAAIACGLVAGGSLDVATANQPRRYYDLWALRTARAPGNSWARAARYDANRYAAGLSFFFPEMSHGADALPATGDPVEVLSAFGGLGVFSCAALRDRGDPGRLAPGLVYDGRDAAMAPGACFPWLEGQDCEHCAFFAALRAHRGGDLRVAIVPQLLNCGDQAAKDGASKQLTDALLKSMLPG
ncbi:alpha-1,3-mannosyltransferase [Aureococcus anophagefferens]|uniref:Alpha-1,3-mannosyltransferase n=1 Tax=Aureococcus anophagefferens TaxID=44056 RepID=A0ABR1FP11_AURAN